MGESTVVTTKAPGDRNRLFYAGAAVLVLVLTFWGFVNFYLHGKAFPGRPLTPPIRTLIITHGIAMSAWVLLFLVQPVLIALRKYNWHIFLGRIGAVLAVAIFVFGMKLAIGAARHVPTDDQRQIARPQKGSQLIDPALPAELVVEDLGFDGGHRRREIGRAHV